nr:MAG TPA: hypothetical protein [Caudoviricetes sp.]
MLWLKTALILEIHSFSVEKCSCFSVFPLVFMTFLFF